ncbi:thioredoxin domain-containing protein [Corynebacterium felinum]|uniref:Protein-disulfide isomerase n=1 Tax=Corynebacterium felinum TaxID=131318 RepID=A0ABU2B504_9CORY|nr:DsbA family protein [Corynebacterium felinum]MDF5820330.1 thioredoxin domain-containing protein [Corynebacterium felinum]MDR7353697.1 protein-disulfide isomerase [Corynebacterium felinum]WJY95876.1 hypothetical protein CFELI_11430 [Corynebacterium felinum]
MSTKIKNPNQKSSGFLLAIVALLIIAIAVVGYVVVSGKKAAADKYANLEKEPVAFGVKVEDNAIVLKSDKAAADAKHVEVYEDYSCSYCAKLAKDTDAQMKQLIEDGKVIVHVRSLNFLDRADSGHSTKAGATAYSVAKSGNAEAYWNLRARMMNDQEKIYGVWDEDIFSQVARGYGASDSIAAEVKEMKGAEEFISVAQANADKLKKATDSVSSPRVFIDGKELEGTEVFSWPSQI